MTSPGDRSLTVFISLLELQDLKREFSVGDQLKVKLSHRPGLRATGSVWALPPAAKAARGAVEQLSEESSTMVFRPMGAFVYLPEGPREAADLYVTNEVFDTFYLLSSSPDQLAPVVGTIGSVSEIRRTFFERDGRWHPAGGAPRLTDVGGASWKELTHEPAGDVTEKLDGFLIVLSLAEDGDDP